MVKKKLNVRIVLRDTALGTSEVGYFWELSQILYVDSTTLVADSAEKN